MSTTIKDALIEFSLSQVFADAEKVTPEVKAHFKEMLFGNDNFLANQVAMISEAFNENSAGSWAEIQKFLREEFIPEMAAGILNGNARVLILGGAVDNLVPAKFQKQLWAELKKECKSQIEKLSDSKKENARENLKENLVFNIVENQAHMIPQEIPQTLAQIQENFRRKILRTGVLFPLKKYKNDTNYKVIGDHIFVPTENEKYLEKYCRGDGATFRGQVSGAAKLAKEIGVNLPSSIRDGAEWTAETSAEFADLIFENLNRLNFVGG